MNDTDDSLTFSVGNGHAGDHVFIQLSRKDIRDRFSDVDIVEGQGLLDGVGFPPSDRDFRKMVVAFEKLTDLLVRQEIDLIRVAEPFVCHQQGSQPGILGLEAVDEFDQTRFRIFPVHDGLPGFLGVDDGSGLQQGIPDKGEFLPIVYLFLSLHQVHRGADDARQIVHQRNRIFPPGLAAQLRLLDAAVAMEPQEFLIQSVDFRVTLNE